ncbi:MAG: cytochrome-c peroxidase [Geminicoccaceae bacterium]
MWGKSLLGATALTAVVALIGVPTTKPVGAQEIEGIGSLRGKRPNLPNLNGIVRSRTHLKVLGKALFWDIGVGSDGVACASCHFHGGADIRTVNQINPGGTTNDGSLSYDTFDGSGPGQDGSPNHSVNLDLRSDAFPFFIPNSSDPRDPDQVVRDGNDRFSSNGTFDGEFVSIPSIEGQNSDNCNINALHPNFAINQHATRKVEPRQTPTVINAVFNFRNFWDGRANNIFNGVDPFGQRTNRAGKGGVVEWDGGTATLRDLKLRHASLASQAVGPPLSDFEMSCVGRIFADIGRKILDQQPLEFQEVNSSDSVFGRSGLITGPTGLNTTYNGLIELAFERKYWEAPGFYKVVRENGGTIEEVAETDPEAYAQIEHNFSMFWGLALQEYQASLISDRTDFDRNRLNASERRGKDVFENKGKCVNCHKGPLLSGAAITSRDNNVLIEGMTLATETDHEFDALYDDSFYNIGVTPTVEDLGVGGEDPFGNPLSFTRQWKANDPDAIVDKINLGNNGENVDPTAFEVQLARDPGTRDAVDGAFKTPILRNVGTTPPYMHDGSMATLKQVIEFYNRGGNRLRVNSDASGVQDTTGFGDNPRNLDADIGILDLSTQEKEDLRNFLLSLTDDRVLCHKAPFDHPELSLNLGHVEPTAPGSGPPFPRAEDIVKVLPSVGARGYATCFGNDGDLHGAVNSTFLSNIQ